MGAWRLGGTLALALALRTASAQPADAPVDVSVDDLLQIEGVASLGNRAVRTKGTLEMSNRLQGRRFGFALRGRFGGQVEIVPVGEVSYEFETDAKHWLGQEVPGGHDGQTVRVVGKFRGRNLYGDLPDRSQRNSSAWVLKDDLFAVWVTGTKPKGLGFDLDPGLKLDTEKWVVVVGRPETSGAVTYLRALQVEVTSAPTSTTRAQPPPPLPELPKVPPVVVFSLPLDGEREVPTDGRFQVQFSKDMNEQSFKGRVVLRYVGRTLPGDEGFDGPKLSYDGGRRILTVEPGDLLRPGREIELILLPGIVDIDGLPLATRPGKPAGSAADILRFQVVRGALAGGS